MGMEADSKLLAAARGHQKAGRWTAAEAIYRRIINDEPQYAATAFHALGVIALEQGKDKVAGDLLVKAIRLDAGVSAYYVDLASALQRSEHFAEALASAEGALALGDRSTALFVRLFSLYLSVDRPGEAIALLARIDSDPDLRSSFEVNPEQQAVLGGLRRIVGDHAGARADLVAALTISPDLKSAWHELGRIERAGGAEPRAVVCYGRAQTFGEDLDVTFDKGIALRGMEKTEQALSCFQQATLKRPYAMSYGADIKRDGLADVDISPERADAVWARGLESERQGRHLDALACFALASSLTPTDTRARMDLDRLAAQLGKRRVQFYFIHHPSLGLIAQESDLYLRGRQLGQIPDDLLLIFLSGEHPANRTLTTMLSRHLPLIVDDRLYYSMQETLLPGLRASELFLWQNEFENYAHAKSHRTLTFTDEERERGREGLRRMGLDPDTDWFVCAFARDDGWSRKTFSALTDTRTYFRNADIDTYGTAFQSIVDRGGAVIRLGASMLKPLAMKHPRVIDYAMTSRDDFMDIYLVAHCRFIMGTPAGITDVAKPFDAPCLFVNNVPLGFCPYGKGVMYVPKMLNRSASGELVPISEYLGILARTDAMTVLYTDKGLRDLGYAYVDNTPEEIREATEEMLDRQDGRWSDTAEDRELLDRYFALLAVVPRHQISAPARVRQPVSLSHLRRYRSWYFPGDEAK